MMKCAAQEIKARPRKRPEFPGGRECSARTGARYSQVIGFQPCSLGNPGQHSGADLLVVVEGEDEIGIAVTRENSMRTTGLALHAPADCQEGGENLPCLDCPPSAHT